MQVRMRVRMLVLLFALLLAPVLAAPFAPVRGAGAYVGQIWDTHRIYYGQPFNGAHAEFIVYQARSAHLRFWFRNPVNSGEWQSREGAILTCLGSVSCWSYQQVGGVGSWIPDHVDLIANDYYGGGGGYIQDAGPL
jgi:hypothetical protein